MLLAERQRNGLETVGGQRQVEAKLAMAQAELVAIDEVIALQKHQLGYLAGAGPDRALGFDAPDIDLVTAVALPTNLPADLIGRRPDVAAARPVGLLVVAPPSFSLSPPRTPFASTRCACSFFPN